MLRVTSEIAIDEAALDEQFVRATGPGGQNVNKVSTAVQLRFNVDASPALTQDVRARLVKLAGKRVNAAGELIIVAQRHRTQSQNRADARERLAALIRSALEPPRPRKKTRPSAAAKRRRLESKRQRGEIKRARSGKLDSI
jgi:ribosome-associated protein